MLPVSGPVHIDRRFAELAVKTVSLTGGDS